MILKTESEYRMMKIEKKWFDEQTDPEYRGSYENEGPLLLCLGVKLDEGELEELNENEEEKKEYEESCISNYLLIEKGETLTHYAGIGYFTDDNAIYLEIDTPSGKDYYRIDNEPAMIAAYEWDEFLKTRSQAILAEHNVDPKTKVIILETM